MGRLGYLMLFAAFASCTLASYRINNKRLNRVSLHELRQVIRDDLVGVVENALVSMQMGRTSSGGMMIEERITSSVEASVRTMTNSLQDTLRRFETRLMNIETLLEAGSSPAARSRSQQNFLCSEAHERSLQQGVERITAILGSVTERVGEARDAGSAAEQGVARLQEMLPAAESGIKAELKHSIGVIENSFRRQLQGLEVAVTAAKVGAGSGATPPPPPTCDNSDVLAAFKRMESSLTWQVNKVENVVTRLEERAGGQPSRREVDREAAQEVEPYSRSPEHMKSCAELHAKGFSVSGLYVIRPTSSLPKVRVFCEMTLEDGGWTVFQRRGPKLQRQDFNQDWEQYKTGFGTAQGEYWLGNAYLHQLTASGSHVLRVDMLDWAGARSFAQYEDFSVSDEDDKFRIRIGAYTGDAGDSMSMDNNRQFSTRDQDNDALRYGNCAVAHKAGWWFGACRRANLNGVAYNGSHDGPDGINWLDWKGPNYSIKATRMMVK